MHYNEPNYALCFDSVLIPNNILQIPWMYWRNGCDNPFLQYLGSKCHLSVFVIAGMFSLYSDLPSPEYPDDVSSFVFMVHQSDALCMSCSLHLTEDHSIN